MKGSSNWLTTLPLKQEGYVLSFFMPCHYAIVGQWKGCHPTLLVHGNSSLWIMLQYLMPERWLYSPTPRRTARYICQAIGRCSIWCQSGAASYLYLSGERAILDGARAVVWFEYRRCRSPRCSCKRILGKMWNGILWKMWNGILWY